jgi:transcription initiation factor IIE alpha subunit
MSSSYWNNLSMRGNFNTFVQDSKHLLDLLNKGDIDHYEFTLLMILLNQTIGFKKQSDGISLSQWVKRSGLSKDKVLKTLERLQGKKIIKKKKQNSNTKGNHYSRYWLTLVRVADKACPSDIQGLVRVADTQVINNTSKEREGNLFFSKKITDAYIDHIIKTEQIRNKSGFKIKVKRQVENRDCHTLEAISEWLPTYEVQHLMREYIGMKYLVIANNKEIIGDVNGISWDGSYYIVSIGNFNIKFNSSEAISSSLKEYHD